MISEYPLVFGVYDVVSGIAGDLYYLLDCDDILSDTKITTKKFKENSECYRNCIFQMTSIQNDLFNPIWRKWNDIDID